MQILIYKKKKKNYWICIIYAFRSHHKKKIKISLRWFPANPQPAVGNHQRQQSVQELRLRLFLHSLHSSTFWTTLSSKSRNHLSIQTLPQINSTTFFFIPTSNGGRNTQTSSNLRRHQASSTTILNRTHGGRRIDQRAENLLPFLQAAVSEKGEHLGHLCIRHPPFDSLCRRHDRKRLLGEFSRAVRAEAAWEVLVSAAFRESLPRPLSFCVSVFPPF